MECSCCGQRSDRLVAMQSRDDIRLCRACIGWMRAEAGVLDVTPILPVNDVRASVAFYEAAGFEVRQWADEGGYSFVSYDDESVFDLDPCELALDPATNPAGCYVIVPDVDAWHARLSHAGLPVTTVEDKEWGMREFTLTDPSGNHLRIGRST